MLLRFNDPANPATATAAARVLCTALADFMNSNDEFFGADWQVKDTDFSLPVAWDSISGTDVGAAWAEDPESAFVSFCGRSNEGRRWRIEFFTIVKLSASWPTTNRYLEGDDTDPDGIISAFRTAVTDGEPPVLPIDGTPIIPYTYLNISKNGYWERKQRVS